MKYIATATGFVNNRLIERGTVFNYDGEKGSWMEAYGEPQPVEAEAAPLDREAIIAKLKAAGIPYFKGASLDKLKSLLPQEG